MAYFCKNIEYILFQNTKLTKSEIIPKTGFSFSDIISKAKFNFEEREKKARGNVYYEQSLQIVYRYSDIAELQAMSNQYLIVRISGLNTEKFVLGSLENPAEVSFNIKNSIATIKFTRKSLLPESPGTNLAMSYVSETYQPPSSVAELETKTSQFYASANQNYVDLAIEPHSIISILIETTPYTSYTLEGSRISFLTAIAEASQVTINYLIKI